MEHYELAMTAMFFHKAVVRVGSQLDSLYLEFATIDGELIKHTLPLLKTSKGVYVTPDIINTLKF